jgi:cobalt-zinc-cadmium efflux system outer membrane protein
LPPFTTEVCEPMSNKLIALFLVSILASKNLGAQMNFDTVHLKLAEAEKMFLDSNLQLLAQKYNIDVQRALILQARLWPNPNFSLDRGPIIPIHDPNSEFPNSNFFLHSENAASLSQLILLAGKRNKQIKIAQANTTLAEYQFFDLLRTLKYTLRTDFFNIYYLEQSAKVYDAEINALRQIVTAFDQQEGKGYIAEKEVVRIKAQLYSFESEYNDLINQINDTQSELRLVLQVKPDVFIDPLPDSLSIGRLDPARYPLSTLMDSAYHNRTDLQIARTNTNINKLGYDYQKALAVPDLTIGLSYDEQGSYANNFTSLGVSIDLPVLNRNQGNIKSAKAQIANSAALERSTVATVAENVSHSLQKAFAQDRLFKGLDPKFSSEFERLVHEVLINYQKRNISILEFLDFYDSYKQNILQINTIQFNRISAFEDINYYTGTNFFNQ